MKLYTHKLVLETVKGQAYGFTHDLKFDRAKHQLRNYF